MIEATIFRKPDGSYKGFQVLGHADSVSKGADLVCCAVSVLTITLVNSLEKLTDEVYEETTDGPMGLSQVIFKDKPGEKAVVLMDAFLLGMTQMESVYGDWLKVITREV